MKMILLAAALLSAAPLIAGPVVNTTVTFDSGSNLYHYTYEFNPGDIDGLVSLFAVSLPYVGEPDYLPFSIVQPQNWSSSADTCSIVPIIPIGTGCWLTRTFTSPGEISFGVLSFQTGYSSTPGKVIVQVNGDGYVVDADVPNYDNSLIECTDCGAAVPEPSTLAIAAMGLMALTVCRSWQGTR